MNTEVKAPPKIKLKECESSKIHAIGHCPETNRLAVQFKGKGKGGRVYHYANFTADDFAKFERAESKGKHFDQHVKFAKHDDDTLKFPHTKIELADHALHGYS